MSAIGDAEAERFRIKSIAFHKEAKAQNTRIKFCANCPTKILNGCNLNRSPDNCTSRPVVDQKIQDALRILLR